MAVRTPEGEHEFDPGDAVCFPTGPDGAHHVRNAHDVPARVAIVSTKNEFGIVEYPDDREVESGLEKNTTSSSEARDEVPVAGLLGDLADGCPIEPDPTDAPEEESFPWLDDVRARGVWMTGDQLAPPRRNRSVRVRDGKAIVTDGHAAWAREAAGGFDIIDCGSLEEAVEIAAAHPVATSGTIEVRPFWGN